MAKNIYVHGTDSDEQERLALLNRLTNRSFCREYVFLLEPGGGLEAVVRD